MRWHLHVTATETKPNYIIAPNTVGTTTVARRRKRRRKKKTRTRHTWTAVAIFAIIFSLLLAIKSSTPIPNYFLCVSNSLLREFIVVFRNKIISPYRSIDEMSQKIQFVNVSKFSMPDGDRTCTCFAQHDRSTTKRTWSENQTSTTMKNAEKLKPKIWVKVWSLQLCCPFLSLAAKIVVRVRCGTAHSSMPGTTANRLHYLF